MSAAHGSTALGRSVPRLLGSVVAGVCAAAFLAGCTSNAEPTPLPEPSASTSPSARASSAPPSLPPEAAGTSPRAAKAFVRYWVETLNYAGSSGETELLVAASNSQCKACQAVVHTIDTTHASGGTFQGDGWIVRTIKYQPLQAKERPVLTVGVLISPQTVIASAGATPKQFEGGNRSMIFRLDYSGGDWQVMNLEQSS